MADEIDDVEGVETPPEPKAKAPVALVLVVGVLTMGAAAAGAVIGLRYAAPLVANAAPKEEKKTEEPAELLTAHFEPIVVDTEAKDGSIHHLKVGLSFELGDKVTPEIFEKYAPRGREAATVYLRTQKFEDSVKDFDRVRKELSHAVTEAMGKERIHRVLVTDFVAQ